MALPRVKINFTNGAIGTVTPSAECVVGMILSAKAVSTTFELGKAYQIYKTSDAEALGITKTGDNAFAYEQIRQFYAEAGEGAELWIYGVATTVKPSAMLDITGTNGKNFIQQANGRIRVIAACYNASSTTFTLSSGLDEDVATAITKGQELAEWATDSLFAPFFVLVNGYGYSTGASSTVQSLTSLTDNRVGVLIGSVDTTTTLALGLLCGRVAACPVQRHIGRVKDGALACDIAYVGTTDATASTEIEALNTKGYITFRTFAGKSGYYFTDDHLATADTDDYHSICNRRVIDKAYRVAYTTLLEEVNDEIPVTNDGKLPNSICKSIQSMVETAIQSSMTSEGNLGVDPNDDSDTGVKCYVDPEQNVLSTSTININIKVKPYGYARYIDVNLGFLTNNE